MYSIENCGSLFKILKSSYRQCVFWRKLYKQIIPYKVHFSKEEIDCLQMIFTATPFMRYLVKRPWNFFTMEHLGQ